MKKKANIRIRKLYSNIRMECEYSNIRIFVDILIIYRTHYAKAITKQKDVVIRIINFEQHMMTLCL